MKKIKENEEREETRYMRMSVNRIVKIKYSTQRE